MGMGRRQRGLSLDARLLTPLKNRQQRQSSYKRAVCFHDYVPLTLGLSFAYVITFLQSFLQPLIST